MILPLTGAPEVLLADGSHMKVVGKAKCDVTLPNGINYNWPFIFSPIGFELGLEFGFDPFEALYRNSFTYHNTSMR